MAIGVRAAELSHQDNCSFSAANTRQHVSSIFLFRRQPVFGVHLNPAAKNARGARAAETLAAAVRNLHAVFLCQIQQSAFGGNLTNLLRVKEHDGFGRAGFPWTRLRGTFALPETLLQYPFLLYAESRENLASVVHKSLRAAQKESGRIQVDHVLGDKFPRKATGVSLPGRFGLRQAHFVLKVGKRPFKSRQFALKNNVRRGAHTIQERDRSRQFKVVDIAQYRNHWSDPTAGRNENYAFMDCLVKVKAAIRSSCFHPQTRLRTLIEKNRYTAIFRALGRNLHIGPVDR